MQEGVDAALRFYHGDITNYTTESLDKALLWAVNLGDDTDTIGAIAGGLAGLYYGYESAPEEWRRSIIKEKELMELCEKMEEQYNA